MQHENATNFAENNSIRPQAEANTRRKPSRSYASIYHFGGCHVVEPRWLPAPFSMALEQFGPYFVIAPALRCRMAARKKVKKTGFSLVTLKKPLEFNHEDNDPVDILITMARRLMPTLTRSGHHADVNLFEDGSYFWTAMRLPHPRAGSPDLIDRTNGGSLRRN